MNQVRLFPLFLLKDIDIDLLIGGFCMLFPCQHPEVICKLMKVPVPQTLSFVNGSIGRPQAMRRKSFCWWIFVALEPAMMSYVILA